MENPRMTERTLDCSVVDWIIDHPETQHVFESLGIDCSCAGKSLEFVCRQQRLDAEEVLRQLVRAIRRSSNRQPFDETP
jgi:hypothetical protein